MSTTEIRVRPVVRHAVTRFTQDGKSAGSEMIGEFANEAFAEEVAEALQGKCKPRQYIIVERNFERDARIAYADYELVANAMRSDYEQETGKEFRIYSREVTDPMVLARISLQTEQQAFQDYVAMKACNVQTGAARD